MRFFTAAFATVGVLASTVLAAENPIIKPDGSAPVKAGEPTTIKWTPTTEGKVTLTLRKGESDDLKDVTVITVDAGNSGSFTWTPPKDLPAGENYAIMITDAAGESNYTPLIGIDSDVAEESSSASSSSATKTSKSKSPSSTATSTESSSTEESTKTRTTKAPKITAYHSGHNSTMTTKVHHNSTTKSSNTTTSTKKKSSSKTTSLEPTATEDSSATNAPTAASTSADSSAMALVRSPLALVVCVVAALLYVN